MQPFTKRVIRFALVAMLSSFALSFAGTVWALPDSTVNVTPTNSGDISYTWPAPAGGFMTAQAGNSFVTGVSSFFDGEDNQYNQWVTTDATVVYEGEITDVDLAKWHLMAFYPGEIRAGATYVSTGAFPVEEAYRAETTGIVQVTGDFVGWEASQVVVDSITKPGQYGFFTPAGGVGSSWVESGVDGIPVSLSRLFGYIVLPPEGQEIYSHDVNFSLYCYGKQYMHSNEEEDVSLSTHVLVDDDWHGTWTGVLAAWGWVNGGWKVIDTYYIG
ncbi:MAG: hypothetical protein IPK87_05770 [Planctomycetes bacterium]|nr:hypothetical protein [Planctomycetota bacterium]